MKTKGPHLPCRHKDWFFSYVTNKSWTYINKIATEQLVKRRFVSDDLQVYQRGKYKFSTVDQSKENREKVPTFRSNEGTSGLFCLVHTCLYDNIETAHIERAGYFINLIDDHPKWDNTFPMRKNWDAKASALDNESIAKRQTGQRIRALLGHIGNKYLCTTLRDHFHRHICTVPIV